MHLPRPTPTTSQVMGTARGNEHGAALAKEAKALLDEV